MSALTTRCESWCNSHPHDAWWCTRRTLRAMRGMGVEVCNDEGAPNVKAWIDIQSLTADQARDLAAALLAAAETIEGCG